MSILDLTGDQDYSIMPYFTFERIPYENKQKSLEAGHYVADDVDIVSITPPYSKDIMKHKVKNWLVQIEEDTRAGRIPREWLDRYKKGYNAWKEGQELPLDGFPVKGWGLISPAQQETLIRLKILTVEQLSEANAEGLSRIGIGAIDLKNKAIAWLKQINKSGSVAMENAHLRKKVEAHEQTIASLESKVKSLESLLKASNTEQNQSISIDELI